MAESIMLFVASIVRQRITRAQTKAGKLKEEFWLIKELAHKGVLWIKTYCGLQGHHLTDLPQSM
jgi:hypothetical protein